MTEYLIRTPVEMARVWWSAVSQTLGLTPQVLHNLGFALRTLVASMLALYVAFVLQLESPVWAWLTAYIVSQTTPGMALSKSLYRFVGTIAGSVCGIVLIALFAQTPELFVLGLALLVGGCTVLSSLQTNFRAYATALTAYTAGIIASDAINAPDQVFFIAMARTSCILIGIASVVVVTWIFAPQRSAAAARSKLLVALQDAARRAAFSWTGSNEERLKIGRKLIQELIELDTVIEYAAAESANFRLQANHARSLVAHIFSLISARRALDAHLIRCGWPKHHALEIFHGVILDFLHEMPDRLERGEVDELIAGLREVRDQLARVCPEEDTEPPADLVSERFVIDRLDDLLANLDGTLDDWRDILQLRYSNEPRLGLNFHRDVRAAWINGLRAFIAVIVTGAFWIGSAWPNGPGALIFVCVLLSLFATQPHPDRVGWLFFQAGNVAFVMALVCKFLVLTTGTGFEFLVAALSLFLIPLGMLLAHPKTALPGAAFMFVFLSLVAPSNPMVYDLSASLNNGIATQVGILFGTLAFILVLPPDPVVARRYVTYRIRRGLEMISLLQPVPPTNSHWETRMYDRVMRLNNPLNPSGTPTDEWLDAGLGALNLGNEILRMRRRFANETMPAEVRVSIGRVIEIFNRFLQEPQLAVGRLRQEIHRVSHLDPGRGHAERRGWARVLGSMEEMELYLVSHPRLTKMEAIS